MSLASHACLNALTTEACRSAGLAGGRVSRTRRRAEDASWRQLPGPRFRTPREALDWLDAERGNLLAVQALAVAANTDTAVWQLAERAHVAEAQRLEREHVADVARLDREREQSERAAATRFAKIEDRPAMTMARWIGVAMAVCAALALMVQAYGTLRGAK